jgi:hypothetical protein
MRVDASEPVYVQEDFFTLETIKMEWMKGYTLLDLLKVTDWF